MSRGPGVMQRLILNYLQAHPCSDLSAALHREYDRSEYLSGLRAAHRLEAQGALELLELGKPGNSTLILCRPGETITALKLRPGLRDQLDAEAGQYALVRYAEHLLGELELTGETTDVSQHREATLHELTDLGIDRTAVKARAQAEADERFAELRRQWDAEQQPQDQSRKRRWISYHITMLLRELSKIEPVTEEEGRKLVKLGHVCREVDAILKVS